jgi:hypothetical protein
VTLAVRDRLMPRRHHSGVSSEGLGERARKALQPDARGYDVGASGRSLSDDGAFIAHVGDFQTACSAPAVAFDGLARTNRKLARGSKTIGRQLRICAEVKNQTRKAGTIK